jgi:hypothetical protein
MFIKKKFNLGIGDCGLGIGDWGLGPIPNPQSPIPNPQSPIPIYIILTNFILIISFNNNFLNKTHDYIFYLIVSPLIIIKLIYFFND